MTAQTPPTPICDSATGKAAASCPISSLTAIRSAWKTRRAGWPRRRAACGTAEATTSASCLVEVKGRAGVGEVALLTNEYKTAERLKKDYWLYVVFNCASKPEAHVVQDHARLGWEPLVKIEHYSVPAEAILQGEDRRA